MSRIAVVEDEAALAESLAYALEREGHQVQIISDGLDALEKLLTVPPDLVILDRMLPSLEGLEVCRRVHRHFPNLPILILSARAEPEDRIEGLRAGAEDYVVKPFSLKEVQARIEILLRRNRETTSTEVLEAGPFKLDLVSGKFYLDGQEQHLSPKESDLLTILLETPGGLVRREHLLSRVWGEDFVGDPKTVDVHIRWLREKIEADPGRPRYLKTVRGRGFRLEL